MPSTKQVRAEPSPDLEHLLSRIIDAVDDAIIAADLNGTILSWNRAAARIYGYSAEEIVGRHVAVLAAPDRPGEPLSLIDRVAAGEQTAHAATVRRHKNGGLIECSVAVAPVRDNAGAVVGVCGITRDVTPHATLTRRLFDRESQFAGLLDQAVSGIYILSASGDVQYVNAGFSRLFGYATDEVIGQPMSRFVAEDDRGRVAERMQAAFAGPSPALEARLIARDGSSHTVLAQSAAVSHDGQPALLGVVIDITDQRQSERELERANRLLRTIGAANEALVRASTEAELMTTMCDVLVSVGNVRAAAIGQRGEGAGLRLVASAQARPEYLAALQACCAAPGGAHQALATGVAIFDADGACAWLPLADGAAPFGCLCLHVDPDDAFRSDETALLKELADDLAYGIVALRHRVQREAEAERVRRSMEEMIAALAATVEMRDPYTAGHQRSVARLAEAIGREMGLDESCITAIRLAALIHDIGKIKIPAEILTRPVALTAIEEQLLRTHSAAGYDILRSIDFPWPLADIVRQHHERLDGSGYPDGLTGDRILVESQVLAVADTVEAMSANRPYRFGKGMDAALAEIERGRGVCYNSQAVDACLALFREKRFAFAGPSFARGDHQR